MARLDTALKVRLESTVKRDLEERAEKADRSAGALARHYIVAGMTAAGRDPIVEAVELARCREAYGRKVNAIVRALGLVDQIDADLCGDDPAQALDRARELRDLLTDA